MGAVVRLAYYCTHFCFLTSFVLPAILICTVHILTKQAVTGIPVML